VSFSRTAAMSVHVRGAVNVDFMQTSRQLNIAGERHPEDDNGGIVAYRG